MAETFSDDSVSLNKYIADTGFCSRRDADKYIEQNRVTINGKPAKAGNRVKTGAVVELDGEPLGRKKATMYIAYHKPVGVTSTTDTRDKSNIIDAIGHKERIFPVGRLDKDSEGLIFLTNDGNIVNKILRAGNQHDKEYVVRVDKPVTPEFIQSMSSGVRILDAVTLPCKVVQEGKQGFRITLRQGLNRQIRRMCTALGYEVLRLKRLRIMNVHLADLAVGHWRYLTQDETKQLMLLVAESREDEGAGAKSEERKGTSGVRKGKSGVRRAESDVQSAKSEVRSVKSEERKGKSEERRAESGVRRANSEVRGAKGLKPGVKKEVRKGKSGVRRAESDVQSANSEVRSVKSEERKGKSEERRAESGVGSANSEVRGAKGLKPGVKKEAQKGKSGERSVKSEVRSVKSGAKAEAGKKEGISKKSSYKDFKKGGRKRP